MIGAYDGEDLRVSFDAGSERTDCGPGTPVETYPTEITVRELFILDVPVDWYALRKTHPDLAAAIYDLHYEVDFTDD